MGNVKIYPTPLTDLILIETSSTKDERGQFTRVFCESDFSKIRSQLNWTQINLSKTSRKGTVRGMHFQHPPAAEAKLVRCLRGHIFDVAIDLRADSPTFLKWYGTELSENKSTQIFIPEGFAHGFQTLTDDAELLYMHTVAWNPGCEGQVRYDDPRVQIKWPLTVAQISVKDQNAPLLAANFAGLKP